MPHKLTNDKSTLVQVMAWCRQAASHYLTQRWPWSMSPYGVTTLRVEQNGWRFADSIFKNMCILIQISLKFVLQCLIDKIGSANRLVLTKWQANTWTNDDPVHCHVYVSLGLNELRMWFNVCDLYEWLCWKYWLLEANHNITSIYVMTCRASRYVSFI